MQGNGKSAKESIVKTENAARRTTIILDKEERDYVDSLIREGKNQE